MATLAATITADARKYWPQLFGALFVPTSGPTQFNVETERREWNPVITRFKVGEGGWIDPGTGEIIYRVPDPNLRRLKGPITGDGKYLQDLDAVVDQDRADLGQATRYSSASRSTFTKVLTVVDFSWEAPSTLRVRCLLDNNDYNTDGALSNPEIWELGIFSDHPEVLGEYLMIAYATFPKETKTSTKQIENVVRITF